MSIGRVCAKCGRIGCQAHKRKPWQGARRNTISGYAQQRRAQRILARDSNICHVCGLPGATQADHVIPLSQGGPDTEENMAAIHAKPCHDEKTQREAQAHR